MRKSVPQSWFTPAARRANEARMAKRRQQKDDEPEKGVDVRKHKAKEIRRLCNLLSDQFSDGRNVSARQVLDALEQFWGECRAELAKGRE